MTLHFRNPRWLPFLGVFQPKLYFYPNILNTINLIELLFNDKHYLGYYELIQHNFCLSKEKIIKMGHVEN